MVPWWRDGWWRDSLVARRPDTITTEKAVTKAENAIIAAMRTAYFTTKLNIPISHYGEMIEFLKFQGKLLLLDFCSSKLRDFILLTFMSRLKS